MSVCAFMCVYMLCCVGCLISSKSLNPSLQRKTHLEMLWNHILYIRLNTDKLHTHIHTNLNGAPRAGPQVCLCRSAVLFDYTFRPIARDHITSHTHAASNCCLMQWSINSAQWSKQSVQSEANLRSGSCTFISKETLGTWGSQIQIHEFITDVHIQHFLKLSKLLLEETNVLNLALIVSF